MPFSHTNPPTRRRKIKDAGFLLIREDQNWQNNIEVFTLTQAGCFVHPDNTVYEMEDGASITVYDGIIDEIAE